MGKTSTFARPPVALSAWMLFANAAFVPLAALAQAQPSLPAAANAQAQAAVARNTGGPKTCRPAPDEAQLL